MEETQWARDVKDCVLQHEDRLDAAEGGVNRLG